MSRLIFALPPLPEKKSKSDDFNIACVSSPGFPHLACNTTSGGKILPCLGTPVAERAAPLSPCPVQWLEPALPSPGAVSGQTCALLCHGQFNNVAFLTRFEVDVKVRKETAVIICALLSEGYSFSYPLHVLIV